MALSHGLCLSACLLDGFWTSRSILLRSLIALLIAAPTLIDRHAHTQLDWDEVERASLVAEVKQQHAAREASRSPAARKMKVLRRSVKELGVAAADTLVDETKDLPTVRLRSSAFLICGVS